MIKRYTIEERKEKKVCHGHLRPENVGTGVFMWQDGLR